MSAECAGSILHGNCNVTTELCCLYVEYFAEKQIRAVRCHTSSNMLRQTLSINTSLPAAFLSAACGIHDVSNYFSIENKQIHRAGFL